MSLKPLEGFLAVRSEGGLLPADLLQRIVAGDRQVEGLDPQRNYHLAGGERLNEAVSRSWQRLLGAWRTFRAAASFLEASDPGTTLTRERWLLVVFQELGYGRLSPSRAVSLEGREYPISHAWQRVPIHLVGCQVEIDKRTPGVAGAARTTPHGLVQDFINRSPDHLWGFVSNGLRLRILRDNARLTRQAYVEFDVETIFENELFADFGLLWLLGHQSRVEHERPDACWLERWRESAATQGARALDTLRDGVEAALSALGRGFLAHPANAPLKAALQTGSLSTQDYYRELLRLVYRLLFLFVAEDRDVLHPRNAVVVARKRYQSHYSSRRLRELARGMRGSGHADLFRMVKVVVAGLSADAGCPALGLPALGGLLWSAKAAPHLDAAELANRAWLEAVRALAYTKQDGVLRPVDWRNLGSTELGSVYESLLELHPDVNADAATFSLTSAAGNERKTSGSYYTPDSLVQCLLDSALDPVLAEAASGPDPERAILALKVCDPACGSGHFLIAAAHRIARRLARVRTGDDEPAPEATRTALRDVIGRCLCGVDLNPMAAELCKVNLWLEGMEPGRPLSFLDHHIRIGNSLVGATPTLIAEDIPDSAFEPIEGDDKKTCSALKKRNRLERDGQQDMLHLMVAESHADYLGLADQAGALDGIDDTSLVGVLKKESHFQRLVESAEYRHAQLVADAWCAVFVWKKASDVKTPVCITTDSFRRLKTDATALSEAEETEVRRLAVGYSFFHWQLSFPEVFARGGFDVVLGNPPWERVKLQEKEWFAERSPEIAKAPNAAVRKGLIASLKNGNPALYQSFLDDSRRAEGESHLMRDCGRYPLCGRGDINTYALFAELSRSLLSSRGSMGVIVPSGIATDDTTKMFFQSIIDTRSLVSLYGFENEEFLFPGVHHSTTFVLITVTGPERPKPRADLLFFARQTTDLTDEHRRFSLASEDFALLNPTTRTCPVFRTKRDAEITKEIYRRIPVLAVPHQDESNPWNLPWMEMIHMSNDSSSFRTREDLEREGGELADNVFTADGGRYLALYEAKMIWCFDHRYGTYSGQSQAQRNQGKLPELSPDAHADPTVLATPQYWLPESLVHDRVGQRSSRRWILGWRKITRNTNQRTFVSAVLPWCGVANSAIAAFPSSRSAIPDAGLVANVCAIVFDYVVRQKLGGTNLLRFITEQLPVIPPDRYTQDMGWRHGEQLGEWLLPRVLELTFTAWDVSSFAQDCGYNGPPFRWNDERRFAIRCELDAAFFHLYGVGRDDAEHILDSFAVLRRNDEQAFGEYRTKVQTLECYDAMVLAIASGVPYETLLDPPPADPRVAHGAPRAVAAPTGLTKVLPFRRLGRAPKRDERYETVVPLLTLKAAAGTFGETQDVEFDEWVELPNPPQLQKGMFLAQVTGRSMEPEIPEGSYCLFRYVRPGSREGKVVLVQLHGHSDPESGGSYTVKRYHSEKERDEDGGWRHARIVLTPANPEYEPIVLGAEDEGEVKVVAELVKVF